MAKRPKGRVILVSIVPKIPARWRQMDFCIFCEKTGQNQGVLAKQYFGVA